MEEQQKILLQIINRPTQEYFLCRSPQAKAFKELNTACKLGCKSETSRKKKWNVSFVAEHLALLLVLLRQVLKEKEAQLEVDRSSRSDSEGVPKNTPLKCAFRNLWAVYKPSLKLYTKAERDEKNKVQRTPSLSLQLTGARDQDLVP